MPCPFLSLETYEATVSLFPGFETAFQTRSLCFLFLLAQILGDFATGQLLLRKCWQNSTDIEGAKSGREALNGGLKLTPNEVFNVSTSVLLTLLIVVSDVRRMG